MDDPLAQALTQLVSTLIILARERDTMTAALVQLRSDVGRLQDELAAVRGQLDLQCIATPAITAPPYPSLASETRENVDTACAAFHLGRKVQTLRKWASDENGPLRPIRLHGRLAWSVTDLRRLVSR
jgi:hypothetical protein